MQPDQIISHLEHLFAPLLPSLRDQLHLQQVSQALRHFGEGPRAKHTLILTRKESIRLYQHRDHEWAKQLLKRIHTLDLSDCQNITDVSQLGQVHTLNLSNSHRIHRRRTVMSRPYFGSQ